MNLDPRALTADNGLTLNGQSKATGGDAEGGESSNSSDKGHLEYDVSIGGQRGID